LTPGGKFSRFSLENVIVFDVACSVFLDMKAQTLMRLKNKKMSQETAKSKNADPGSKFIT